jgi:hypothetical protein
MDGIILNFEHILEIFDAYVIASHWGQAGPTFGPTPNCVHWVGYCRGFFIRVNVKKSFEIFAFKVVKVAFFKAGQFEDDCEQIPLRNTPQFWYVLLSIMIPFNITFTLNGLQHRFMSKRSSQTTDQHWPFFQTHFVDSITVGYS